MNDSKVTRDVVLGRIIAANRRATTLRSAQQAWSEIPRDYRQGTTDGREEMIALFAERLAEYEAQVERTRSTAICSVVERVLSERGRVHMLMPAGVSYPLPGGVSYPLPGFFTLDEDLSCADLDRFDGVLTEATLAIAETGTLVLQSVPGQGRRAVTLVPDFHLCLLKASNIVATVPEAMNWLEETAHLPTTFVSGPSATADIEMTRIKGVHGPRFLHVLIID